MGSNPGKIIFFHFFVFGSLNKAIDEAAKKTGNNSNGSSNSNNNNSILKGFECGGVWGFPLL
jgi:hypothetical protein